MKKILLLILFITAYSNAQNSITIVSIPAEVEQGATFDVTFEYTSDAVGTYELQFYPMDANGQPVWSMGNQAYVSGEIAVNATAAQVTASVTIPGGITLTADLTAPAVSWGVFGKIASSSEVYLSSYPTVNVVAGQTSGEASAGTISMVSFPTEVAKGSTFNVTFEYTSNFVGNYELQFIPMTSEGQPVWGQDKAFASDAIAVNASATQVTVPITLPDDITLSVDLASPAVAWGLFGKIADANADVAYLSPYPQTNVVTTLSVINYIFDKTTIFYNSSKNTLEVNLDKITAKSLQIYDMTGKMIMDIKDAKITSSIDVSSLSEGMYIVRSESKFLKFLK